MANGFTPHLIDGATRDLLADLGACRAATCPVVQRHPEYPTPQQPPFYHGPRPCNPVVPTYAASGKVMVIGQFPNCRFGSVSAPNGDRENFVPVGDILEPFEGGRYFDGYSVRDYPTAGSLHANYFKPLGLNLAEDIWLTNMVKCYLMKQPANGQGRDDIATYEKLGWKAPADALPQGTFDDYFDVAEVCIPLWLINELQLCQPQLIIALGERSYRLIHGSDDFATPGPNIIFDDIVGVPLPAGVDAGPLDTRNVHFRNRNVIHLSHPSRLLYDGSRLTQHLQSDIPITKQFLQQVGLGLSAASFTLFQGQDQQYYFNLRAGNGEIILQSEGYVAQAGAINGIKSVRQNAPLPQRYAPGVTNNGQFYFNLKAGNGQVIGTSEAYTTAAERDNGIQRVQQLAPAAGLVA